MVQNWKPVLNSRLKQVALNIASGMTQTDAYENVYHCLRDTATQAASDLVRRNPVFVEYLNRLIEAKERLAVRAAVSAIADATEIKTKLTDVFRGQIGDFLDDDGELQINKKSPHLAAIREVQDHTWTDKDGKLNRRRTIKLADPVPVAAELNKMAGNYAPARVAVAQRVEVLVRVVPMSKGGEGEK